MKATHYQPNLDSSDAPTLLGLFATEEEVKDLEIINERADDLNREALDVLDFQIDL